MNCRLWLISFQLALALPVIAADSFSSAYISEFMAENLHGLKDEEGHQAPWIELHNGGSTPINLSGWFLTDTASNLTRWRFPGVVLLPDKYMVVFASGKNRTNDLAHLHTNFRVNKDGGYLALVSPATNVVSEFAPSYPKQSADLSYGRVRGDRAISGAMQKSTPGAANASAGAGFAPEVFFSRASGSFTEPFTLQLSSGTNGTVVHYTLDGSLPGSNAPAYSAPLSVTNTAYIRARTYQAGVLPGPPHSEAYLKLSSNVLAFSSSLPLIVLDTFGKSAAVGARESFVHASFYDRAPGRPSLTNAPVLSTRAGFRVRGSSSSGFRQSPFALTFLDEFNEEQHHSPLGLPADSDWVLYAPNDYDLVMIHNPFIYQLSRDMGCYSPRTRFVEVFVARSSGSLNDSHYYGVYVLTEKIKIGKERVNVDHLTGDDLKPPNVTGGYLLKFDRPGPGENGFYGSGERGLVYVEPKEQTILLPQRAAQHEYLRNFFGEFNAALQGQNWKDPARGYPAHLDVDAAIDFHVLEVLSGNVDAMVLSTYFHKPRNGKIVFGPHWDFDRALGSTDNRDANPRYWNTGQFFGGEWWPRLFSDPDFWQKWVDRWQDLRRTHFSLANLNSLIDRLCAEVREAQPREYDRWGMQPRGGSYQGEINLMKEWLSNRIDFIDEQLVQPPHLSSDGGRVVPGFGLTLTSAPNATIYYTFDGSDPRLAQGAISSNAIVYSAAIQLKTNAVVTARARNPALQQTGGPPISTPWSRPVTGRFVVTAPVN